MPIFTISALLGLVATIKVADVITFTLREALLSSVNATYKAIQNVKENQDSWIFLANLSYETVKLLLESKKPSRDLESILKQLTDLHDNIHTYYEETVLSRSPLMRILNSKKVSIQIKSYCKDLDQIRESAKFVLLIQIDNNSLKLSDLEQILINEQAQFERILEKISRDLEQNKLSIIHHLEIHKATHDHDINRVLGQLNAIQVDGAQNMDRMLNLQAQIMSRMTNLLQSQQVEAFRINTNKIKNKSKVSIGSGGFGVVYKATYFGSPVALKQLQGNYTDSHMIEFRREVNVWKCLNHPNVLSLLGVCDKSESPIMVSPFLKNGNLLSFLSQSLTPQPVSVKTRLMHQVSGAMDYLHDMNVIHGDLKPVNILIDDGLNAVVCDFGMSRTKNTEYITTRNQSGGTPVYMAPEMLRGDSGSTKAADVYAFGISLYQVLNNGGAVWVARNGDEMHPIQLVEYIKSGNRPSWLPDTADEVWNVIEKCWHHDPSARPNFDDEIFQVLDNDSHASMVTVRSTDTVEKNVDSRFENPDMPGFNTTRHELDDSSKKPSYETVADSFSTSISLVEEKSGTTTDTNGIESSHVDLEDEIVTKLDPFMAQDKTFLKSNSSFVEHTPQFVSETTVQVSQHTSEQSKRVVCPRDDPIHCALFFAVVRGDLEAVSSLIEKGADFHYTGKRGWNSVIMAAHKGSIEILKVLLLNGADANSRHSGDGDSALIEAVRSGHEEIVNMLLEHGADVHHENNVGLNSLICAAAYGRLAIVNMLLVKGADVNHQSRDGWSPLLKATEINHFDIIKMLLAEGADVNHHNRDGWSPLLKAAENGHVEIAKMLLEKGAHVNHQSNKGNSSLLKAAKGGHTELVNMLLEYGADLNHHSSNGDTALIRAAKNRHTETVKLLLSRDAELHPLKTMFGSVKCFEATRAGNKEIRELIDAKWNLTGPQ